MKKILLLLGITSLSLNNSAFGYDIYYVPATKPYTYQFNVFAPGEDDKCTRDYPLSQNELEAVFQAGIFWQDILNPNPLNPAIYSLKPINDYNAYSFSNYVTIQESQYKVTQVNAVLNNRTITTPAEYIDDSDAVISIGISMDKELETWSTDTTKTALYQGIYPDLLSLSLHEIMHSLGLSLAAAKYRESEGDNTYYFSKDVNEPLSIHDYYLRLYTGDTSLPFDKTKEMKTEKGMAVGEGGFNVIKYSA